MTDLSCKLCRERGKTWQGDDPKCAFLRGVFSSDNWNCATMNTLREVMGEVGLTHRIDDQTYGLLFMDGACLYVSWYKNRGKTESAWLMEAIPRAPMESELILWLDANRLSYASNKSIDWGNYSQ